MNKCALCKANLQDLSVTCFNSQEGGHFNICFKCAHHYYVENSEKELNEIALEIVKDLEK